MAQLFHRRANTIAKASLIGGALAVVAVCAGFYAFGRSDYWTRVGAPIEQPVPFSHQHHVAGLGIDCRYCHTSVETSNFAGIPPTATCMNCHAQIWTSASMLEPVRSSYANNQPLQWQRVHRLPDFVHFNHSIHVAKGVGCATCHGRIDQMPLTYQASPLTMQWCLDCHRNPA